jgi:hypothetical protein
MAAEARTYVVSIDVPRAGGWRAWNTAAERFEQQLTAQVGPPVLDAQIDSETRQGRDYVRIRVTVDVAAADVAGAVGAAWGVFEEAAGAVGGWDLAAARAEVHPAAQRPTRIRPARRPLPADTRIRPARRPLPADGRPVRNGFR